MSPLEFMLLNGWLYYNETDTLSVLCPIHGDITSKWNGRRWLGELMPHHISRKGTKTPNFKPPSLPSDK